MTVAQRQKRKQVCRQMCKQDVPCLLIALNKLSLSCKNKPWVGGVNRGAVHCTISDYRAVWLN